MGLEINEVKKEKINASLLQMKRLGNKLIRLNQSVDILVGQNATALTQLFNRVSNYIYQLNYYGSILSHKESPQSKLAELYAAYLLAYDAYIGAQNTIETLKQSIEDNTNSRNSKISEENTKQSQLTEATKQRDYWWSMYQSVVDMTTVTNNLNGVKAWRNALLTLRNRIALNAGADSPINLTAYSFSDANYSQNAGYVEWAIFRSGLPYIIRIQYSADNSSWDLYANPYDSTPYMGLGTSAQAARNSLISIINSEDSKWQILEDHFQQAYDNQATLRDQYYANYQSYANQVTTLNSEIITLTQQINSLYTAIITEQSELSELENNLRSLYEAAKKAYDEYLAAWNDWNDTYGETPPYPKPTEPTWEDD